MIKTSMWILTDDDSQQYVRKNSSTEFSLVEMSLINPETKMFEVYTDTIDISDYIEEPISSLFPEGDMYAELVNIIESFGYSGVEEIQNHYGEEANQVIAECIFEYYGSFQANVRFTGSENECIKYIQEYICS